MRVNFLDIKLTHKNIRELLFCIPFCAGSIFYFETTWIYFGFIVWFLLYAPKSLLSYKFIRMKIHNIGDCIPLLMVIVWFYGIFLGFLNVKNTENIYRNYFGMLLYITYPIILYYWNNLDSILSIIRKLSIYSSLVLGVVCIYSVITIFLNEGGLNPRLLMIVDIGMVAIRLHYAANAFLILSGAYIFITDSNNKNNIAAVLLFIYLLSFSKIFFIVLLMFLLLIAYLKIFRIRHLIIGILISFSLILSFYSLDQVLNFFIGIEFNNGNPRAEQAQYLIDDFTFFGHGLGAPLSNSNYVRDDFFDYSFELTYHNLIHKLGIFSLIIFFSYGYTVFRGVLLLNNKNNNSKIVGGLVLVLMSFALVGYANPIIFNPICVIEHLFALALLRVVSYKKMDQLS